MNNFVITIGRQLGSGGLATACMLAEQLGVSMYDKNLLLEVSKESGIASELFEKSDEKAAKRPLARFFGLKSSMQGNYAFSAYNIISDEELFKIQSEVMKNIVEKESCIIVGRCADYVLRDHPRRLSVFISASLEDRVARLAATKEISKTEACRLIEKCDRKRAEYYNYYTFKEWGSALSYDLCLDSGKLGSIENVVKVIRNYMEIINF
ncbi:MAG: cytidylate kinase-like family protein [Bacteroidales bacterium]|nr:cytidylate kinase-like family protein [Bacteroidales bacterium]